MTREVGVWIDHRQAIIVSALTGDVTTRTLTSDVQAHPRYSGPLEAGGEKKYEHRHGEQLDQWYDEVIRHLERPDALLILGPGEAKQQLKQRLGRVKSKPPYPIAIQIADKLTEPQIVARVKQHFGMVNDR